MNKLKYVLPICMLLLLVGCQTSNPISKPAENSPSKVKPVEPEKPPEVEPIPEPPKLHNLNWLASLQPLMTQLAALSSTETGQLLLADGVRNATNGSIQSGNANTVLSQQLSGLQRFTLINSQQLALAKQALGLSANDNLRSKAKAMALARNLQADFVLYTTVTGDVKNAIISMQLMLVSSGEIIWSEQQNAVY